MKAKALHSVKRMRGFPIQRSKKMKIIEMRTLEIVCHNLPRIAAALDRIAKAAERQNDTDNVSNVDNVSNGNTDKTVKEV